MRRISPVGFSCVTVIFFICFTTVPLCAKTTLISIGTGGITGPYYPTGGAIAKIINKERRKYGIRCNVESTGGSVYNVNAIMGGDFEFGIVQSDRQYQAYAGLAADRQPDNRSRFYRPFHCLSAVSPTRADGQIS
jgi:TRAP transporter TAXI family solute receptor